MDALGQPTWAVTPAEVSRAYRKLSILVHPDKNPGEEARAAFEALNEAHRALKDPGKLVGSWLAGWLGGGLVPGPLPYSLREFGSGKY